MSLLTHLHPASIHFPIAFLLLASSAGLLYLYWRPHATLQTIMWWSLLLGWIGGLVAVGTGLLAQSGLPPQSAYRPILNWHITTGLAMLVVYGALLYWRWIFHTASSQRARARVANTAADLLDDPRTRFGCTLLLIAGALCVIASGWNGGRLVYEWGVNVVGGS